MNLILLHLAKKYILGLLEIQLLRLLFDLLIPSSVTSIGADAFGGQNNSA
jgi:hypothetical protein